MRAAESSAAEDALWHEFDTISYKEMETIVFDVRFPRSPQITPPDIFMCL